MKFVKEFVVPAAILTVICIVISAALALTYNVTEPIIESAKRAEANAARSIVLAGAKDFKEVSVTTENIVEAYEETTGKGFVITAKANGYGGEMQVMVGIKADGTIDSVKLMENGETEGIGSQTGEAKYTDQYKGKDHKLSGIEAISGATISSGAFRHAVYAAFDAYAEMSGLVIEPEEVPFENQAFPDAQNLKEISLEGALKAYTADDKGYVIVIEEQGFEGAPSKMQIYVGINNNGEIVNVVLGKHDETAGLGSKVGEAEFTKQFVGKTAVEGIEAVSGATQSSEGTKKAVTKALEIFAKLKADAPKLEELAYPTAESFEEIALDGAVKAFKVEDGCVIVTEAQGFEGAPSKMQVYVGINNNGEIVNVVLGENEETKGLGSKVGDEDFTKQFVGKTEVEGIDAVAGATQSTNGFKKAVEKALELAKKI